MQKTLFSPPKVEVFKKEIDKVICKPISHRLAKSIIVENHYTHAFPPTKIALGFFVEGNIGGVITFGEGANRNMVPGFYEGLTHEDGLELTRLFAFDWCGKNFESMMISKSFKFLRQNHPEVKVLISYADPNAGHCGKIYQATSWIYCGRTNEISVFVVGGKRYHKTIIFKKFGTNKLDELKKIHKDVSIEYTQGKYRYTYILDRKNRKDLLKRLRYKIQRYPKC